MNKLAGLVLIFAPLLCAQTAVNGVANQKASGDGNAAHYLDGTGAYSTPAGAGGNSVQYASSATHFIFTGGSTLIVADACQVAGNLQDSVSAYSITSNVITVTYTGVEPGTGDVLMGQLFPTSTFLNGQSFTVISHTSTTWTAAFTHANTSATEAGVMGCGGNVVSQDSQMEFFLNSGGKVYNQAVAGTTASAIASAYNTLIHPFMTAGSWLILLPTGNEWTGTGCPTLSSVQGDYASIWDSVHADGGNVLMMTPVGTVSNPVFCPTAAAAYKALTSWIRGEGKAPGAAHYWDKLVTVDSVFDNNADGYLIQQAGPLAGHLTGGGARLMAELIHAGLASKVSVIGTNIQDAVAPISPCGVNNLPCTNTPNTFVGTQTVQGTDGTQNAVTLKQASSSIVAPTIVQGGQTQDVTLTGVSVGHQMLVQCASIVNTGGNETVSDNHGNSYTTLYQVRPTPNLTWAIATVTTGGSVTPVCSHGSNWTSWELANAGLTDGTTAAAWNTSPPATVTLTTTDSSDLIIATFVPGGGGTASVTQTISGWTTDYTNSNTIMNQHRYGSATTYTTAPTWSGSLQAWTSIIALHGSSTPQSVDLLTVNDAFGAAIGTGVDKDGKWRGPIGSSEVVTPSSTPTFSTLTRQSVMTLTSNVTTFTLGAGIDGQEKTLCFIQGSGPYTVAPPANVHGFFNVGQTNAKFNCQHLIYSIASAYWTGDSNGSVNEVSPFILPGTATFTAGTGVTSVACTASYTCTNSRGTFTIVSNTATTGTIATVNFSTTLAAAPSCLISANGNGGSGTIFYDLGHGIPSTSSFTITAGVSVVGATIIVDYQCVL